jgi:alcohol dehydrogenase class IV
MTTIPDFTVPTRVVSGVGSLGRLPAELEALGARRIAVVADRGIVDVGLLQTVLDPIDPALVACYVLIDPDPDVDAAEEAAAAARAAAADTVLAVGGGSALGAAKAVAIRLTNHDRIDAYAGVGRVPVPPAPTVAVPTTAGSGSEVSMVLVLHEPGRPEELVVRSAGCEPRVAVLDATVLRGLPRAPMLYAGLDALSHSLEAQWAHRGSSFTAVLGLGAARAIIDLLPRALAGVDSGRNAEGGNDEVLQRLLEASSAANMACGNSGLALVHALSTAPSVHLPHGLQNGVLLPHVARFNAPVSTPEVAALVGELDALYADLAFEARFPVGTVGDAELEAMVAASTGHPFRANNTRPSTDDELRDLLSAAGASRGKARS